MITGGKGLGLSIGKITEEAAQVITPNAGGGGGALPVTLGVKQWNQLGTGITLVGSNVSEWSDQSGNGRSFIQPVIANRPFGSGVTINSLQAVQMTTGGVANGLYTAAYTGITEFTFVLLFSTAAGAQLYFGSPLNGATDGQNKRIFPSTPGTQLKFRGNGTGTSLVLIPSPYPTSVITLVIKQSGTTLKYKVNNDSWQVRTGDVLNSTTEFDTGFNRSISRQFGGVIGEVQIYDNEITNTNADLLIADLRTRAGL